jgi:hypothetical protein
MAQVFSRRAVLSIKLGWFIIVALAVTVIGIYKWRVSDAHALDAAVPQPIPFSHKHHVGDDGIDCRYCHTTVETSRTAGLPSTEICLDCHSQLFRDAPLLAPLRRSLSSGRPIPWRRVYDLPDFVYFDHSIHVAKGVSCGECHGPVEQMPLIWRFSSLEMQWCLGCHRDPAPHLSPARQVFSGARAEEAGLDAAQRQALARHYRIQGVRRLTDCSTCHR